jgi:hypothetical protein
MDLLAPVLPLPLCENLSICSLICLPTLWGTPTYCTHFLLSFPGTWHRKTLESQLVAGYKKNPLNAHLSLRVKIMAFGLVEWLKWYSTCLASMNT